MKNINIVDVGTVLAVTQALTQAGSGGDTDVLKALQAGSFRFAFRDFARNVNFAPYRNQAIKYASGGLAFKLLAKSLGTRKIAGLGGVSLNV